MDKKVFFKKLFFASVGVFFFWVIADFKLFLKLKNFLGFFSFSYENFVNYVYFVLAIVLALVVISVIYRLKFKKESKLLTSILKNLKYSFGRFVFNFRIAFVICFVFLLFNASFYIRLYSPYRFELAYYFAVSLGALIVSVWAFDSAFDIYSKIKKLEETIKLKKTKTTN